MSRIWRTATIRSCRVLLGFLVMAAALSKIGAPAAFATQVENFDLLPVGWENLVAITVPWIELVAGLALISGVKARSAAWLTVALLMVFNVAVSQAMVRGLNIECGCFGSVAATRVGVAKLLENLAFSAVAVVAALRLR